MIQEKGLTGYPSIDQSQSSNDSHERFKNRVETIANTYSSKTAVTYMRNSGSMDKLTFSDIWNFIRSAGVSFENMGLKQGDRVAIVSPHSPYAVFIGMSLTYYGITIALIDASLPREEINKLIDFSDVRAIFTIQKLYESIGAEVSESIPCFSLDKGLAITPFADDRALCSNQNPTADPENDVIAILYSSGTTGEMKGIKVTYDSVLKAREVFARLAGLEDYMTYMLVLPFNHIAGFTGAMTYFLTGCELGFIEDVNASKLQSGLLKFQPYYFAMVPKVYEVMEQKIRAAIREKGKSAERLMNTLFKVSKFFRKNFGINIGRKMFHSITAQVFGENIFGIGTGASPCKDETTEFFLNLGLEWANLYATTETSVPIVATGIMDRYPVGTVGNVNRHPEISVKIGHPDENGIGEILVKSELMMKGYFRRPDLTAEAFEDGYFKTGDYGYIDKKGYLHITGRIKESVILQSGKKVSPSDVDDYYQERLPDYDMASKGIAVQNGSYDELHLFVATQNYTAVEQNKIRASIQHVSATAPDMYKLSEIHLVSAIPRTSVGKVKRFSLTLEDEPIARTEEPEAFSSDRLIAMIQERCQGRQISMNSKLRDDLGLDSLSTFELVCAIDDEFHVSIESYLHNGITVSEIVDLIQHQSAPESTIDDAYPKEKNKKTIQFLNRWISLSKSIYKIEATGIENIPSNDDYIICANHASFFDPIWILAAMNGKADLEKICCMAAKHTMESEKFFEALGGIPVDREGNTIPAMNCAKRCLEQGKTLMVFPEGARSRDGSMLPFKNGAAALAIDTDKKILPVSIDGSFEIFSRWNKYPHIFDWKHLRKFPLHISFGPPIEPQGRTAGEITDESKQRIVEMKEQTK